MENILRVEMRKDENKREIKKSVCALLNSGGGKLVIQVTDATIDQKDDTAVSDHIIRPVEQYFKNIITLFQVHKTINIFKLKHDCITLHISGLPALCTLSTNMFLPTETEISLIPGSDRDTVIEILHGRRIVDISEQKLSEQFLLGFKCGMRESKTVQFKNLKTEETNTTDFADRIIDNKFTNIISAFANSSGGSILYGIDDRGMVVGESLHNPGEPGNITKKLETAVKTMIWPESSSEVTRGEQWNVKFVPVKNSKNETIPLTFIIVVSVQPCSGGVLTQKPESYYVENNEVKAMPFDMWKANVFYKVPKPMWTLHRISWSTPEEAKKYMRLTQRLENYRQLGKWEMIEKLSETFATESSFSVNSKLVVIFQLIDVKCRQECDVAKGLLEKFREEMDNAADKLIFKVEEQYATSAMELSQGKYRKAWDAIAKGLHFADKAPVGFVTARFFARAASVLSHAVNDESFIEVSKENKDFKKKVDERVERAKNYCHQALQHCMYIEDEFQIAREELKQRVYITLAVLYLKSVDPDQVPASISAIKNAATMITKAEESLMKLTGTLRPKYNHCRLLIVRSDLHFKKIQLEDTVNTRLELLNESLQHIQEAQDLATEHGFEEIKELCNPRKDKIDQELAMVTNDEKETDEMTVDELRSLLDI